MASRQYDMTQKWILGIFAAILVSAGMSFGGAMLQIERVDTREQAHSEETDRALERVVAMIEKVDTNLQWLIKEFVEVRAAVRSQQERRREP